MTDIYAENLKTLTASFFEQQSQLYGDVVYVDLPDLSCAFQGGVDPAAPVEQASECADCALAKTRKHYVPGAGNAAATLMIIGDVPSSVEDEQGLPFIGENGKLLDNILKAIGFDRSEVYVSNYIKCRPPNGRKPRQEEMQRCLPRLEAEIRRIKPRMILALGQSTGQLLLRKNLTIEQMRKQFHAYEDIPLMVTYHTSLLLKKPQWKRQVWDDVQRLRMEYDSVVGDKPIWRKAKK